MVKKNKVSDRQIPFTPDELNEIKQIAIDEGRSFKYQAAQLIKEALAARKEAATNG